MVCSWSCPQCEVRCRSEIVDAKDAEYLEIEKEEAALAWEREKEEDDD
jgi:hypothetical protein